MEKIVSIVIGSDAKVIVSYGSVEMSAPAAECTTSNLFIVKNGAALTPPVDAGLLAGITREFLFEIGGELGIPVLEQVLRDDDLFGADEAFLTSTTRELVPIVRVDERVIGGGMPGPVTNTLLEGFRRRARGM